jgi:hypothetical protein
MPRSSVYRAFKRLITNTDCRCALVIVVATVVFMGPALCPGYTLLPLALEGGIAPWNKQVYLPNQNLLLSDPFYQYYPFRNLIAQSLRQGELALWNPYIFSGHPMMGDLLTQTFYPPNILGGLLFPLARVWVFLIWGHLAITGLFMYGYVRLMGLRPVSALFGALAWTFNAVTVVWLETPHFLSTIAWLPGVFWLLSIGVERRQWIAIAGAGVMFGMLILAGQTQYAIGATWLIGVWAVFHTVIESVSRRRIILWPALTAVVTGLLGIGIGMIQLAPAFEFVQLSHRASPALSLSLDWLQPGWPVRNAIMLWMPDFYGNPVRYPWWRESNIAEMSAYFGLWPFILSLCALVWSKRLDARFWGGVLLIVLLAVWGTPVVYLLRLVPGMPYVTLTRLLFLVPFAGSIASAFALDAAQEHLSTRPKRVWLTLAGVMTLLLATSAAIVLSQQEQIIAHSPSLWPQVASLVLLLLVGCIGWTVARRRLAWGLGLLVLISCVDLLAWGMPFNPVTPVSILYPENPITDWLRQDTGLYRVLPLQSDRVVFGPNVLSVFGFQEPGGYSSQVVRRYRDLGKAISSRVDIWWMAVNRNVLVHSEFDPLFSMLNVKYVLSSYQQPERITIEASPEGCLTSTPLHAGKLITQEFQVANPGLNRIDLRFEPTENPRQIALRFWLWRDHVHGGLIADIPFDGAEISGTGEKVFFFAPVPDSMRGTFVWGIQVVEGEDAGLALCQANDNQGFSFIAYSTQLKFADTRQGTWIYENPNVLPRAYVSHHVEAVTDEEALTRVRNKEFDPWHSVLVSSLSPELQRLTETPPLSPISSASIIEYLPHRVTMNAQTDTPGVLVLSDTWYPGWYVTVNGQNAHVLRVNCSLRGVYLDSGTHQVQFRFRPPSLYFGVAVTTATLLTTALMAWLGWRQRRKRQK